MTKIYTSLAAVGAPPGSATDIDIVTEEVASVHDRGVHSNGLPVIKLRLTDGRSFFVFGTALGFNTAIADMRVTL